MARARRVCPTPNCGNLIDAGTRRCPTCAPLHEHARGSRQQRGYDKTHDRERRRWQHRLDAGHTTHCHALVCLTPDVPITKHTPWDLGHSPDRTGWTGPEHPTCNRTAGGASASRPSL